MTCFQCSHADGYHLDSLYGSERKCFYEDCDCEVQTENENPPSAVK